MTCRHSIPTLIVLIAVMLCVNSCMDVPVNETNRRIFRRPTWWAFYQWGLERSRHDEWAVALKALRQSLGQVEGAIYPGPANDRRRAKTYGLHFLDDYFPHREIGICHFYMGHLEQAEQELQESIQSLPSSRAKYYLNEVQREKLRRQQAEGTKLEGQPTLAVTGIPAEYTTRDRSLTLTVNADSPHSVAEVVIQDRPILLELAQPSLRFTRKVQLKPGRQNLTITATDLAGKQTTWEHWIVCDPEAPTISFSALPAPQQGCELIVRDNIALRSLRINGTECPIPKGTRQFMKKIDMDGSGPVQVDAGDLAGNRLTVTASLPELAADMDLLHLHNPSRLLATAETETLPSIARSKHDTTPPEVRLFPEAGDSVAVTSDVYVLDFLLHDSGLIGQVDVSLNGTSVPSPIVTDRAIITRHALRLGLLPGDNEAIVTATDAHGNTTQRTLMITRKMNCFWREDLRMTTALLPLDTQKTSFLKSWEPRRILLCELLHPPRRLRLLDRDPEVLDLLRKEGLIRQQKLSPVETRETRSTMQSAEWLLQGYTTRWSGRDNWDTVVNIIDTQSGEIVLTVDIHAVGKSRAAVRKAMANLADKIRQCLPTVSAPVTQGEGTVQVALGSQFRISPGMRFVFLPGAGESEISFADPLQRDGKPIQGYVKSVSEDCCRVEVPLDDRLNWPQHGCTAVLR